jgi:hypothetical protein
MVSPKGGSFVVWGTLDSMMTRALFKQELLHALLTARQRLIRSRSSMCSPLQALVLCFDQTDRMLLLPAKTNSRFRIDQTK